MFSLSAVEFTPVRFTFQNKSDSEKTARQIISYQEWRGFMAKLSTQKIEVLEMLERIDTIDKSDLFI